MTRINTDIRRFLIRASLFIAVLFLLDRLAGFGMEKLKERQKAGKYTASSQAFTKADEDIIILGPSTAQNHYDVPLMAQSLKMSVRSVAEPAMCPLFHNVQLHFILKRHIPKLIVMDVRCQELIGKGFEESAMVSMLLPYYNGMTKDNFVAVKDLPDFKQAVVEASLSETFKYNSQILYLLQSNFLPSRSDIRVLNSKGYDALPDAGSIKNLKLEFTDYGFKNTPPQKAIYDAIYNLIDLAKSKKVKVILVIPPRFYLTNDQVIMSDFKKSINSRYGDILYDFSSDTSFYNHPEYFFNRLHLNKTGSDVYTKKILSVIKNKLSE